MTNTLDQVELSVSLRHPPLTPNRVVSCHDEWYVYVYDGLLSAFFPSTGRVHHGDDAYLDLFVLSPCHPLAGLRRW